MKTISVVLCTYNGMKYLDSQLRSILSQSYPVNEIVIGDDMSTDGTWDYLVQIQDEYPGIIKVFQNEKSLGSIKNFEKTLERCTSEWVAFCDQDDLWYNNKIERLMIFANEADLVFSDADLMDEDGKQYMGESLWSRLNFNRDLQVALGHSPVAVLLENFVVTGSSMIVKREEALKSIPFPKDIHHDAWIAWELSLRLGNIKVVEEKLWCYRLHSMQQVGVGLSKDLFSNIKRFFIRNEDFTNQVLVAKKALWNSKHLDKSSVESAFLLSQIDLLETRKNRVNTSFKLLFQKFFNGSYHKHALGTKAFLKDVLVKVFFQYFSK